MFTIKDTIRYVEAIVAGTLKIPFEDVRCRLILRTSSVNSNVNYDKSQTMDIKNLKYVFHLFLDQTKINETISKIKQIYQININSFDSQMNILDNFYNEVILEAINVVINSYFNYKIVFNAFIEKRINCIKIKK